MLSKYVKLSNAGVEDVFKKTDNIYELVKGYIMEISLLFAEKNGIDPEKKEKFSGNNQKHLQRI